MSAPDRSAYAAGQAQLLDALLRGHGFPRGFIAEQAVAAGNSLRRKRGRAVAHVWPALALSLGDTFDPRFDAFVRSTGADDMADPLRLGLAFARFIARQGPPFDDDVRVEIMLARAASRRRGVWIRAARLRHPQPRLLVVTRLPFIGPRHRSIRLPCAQGEL